MSRGREERLEFDDYDDTPRKSWDDFKGRLMNYADGRTNERGWSLADHLMQVGGRIAFFEFTPNKKNEVT